MSLAYSSAPLARKRRPRRQQIPSVAVTEGRVSPTPRPAAPPRRIGKGGRTYSERRTVSDQRIEDMDAAGEPRWKIAAASGLSERQVYRRLATLRRKREVARAARAMMDDTTLFG